MATNRKSKHLQAFIELVKEEWKGTFRKHPDITLLALRDDGVCAALEMRFGDDVALSAVRQLEHDFYTGLHHLVFEFAAKAGDLVPDGSQRGPRRSSTATEKLVAVVDPFDPVQAHQTSCRRCRRKAISRSCSRVPRLRSLSAIRTCILWRFRNQCILPTHPRGRWDRYYRRGDVEVYTKCAYYRPARPVTTGPIIRTTIAAMPDDIVITA